jgi:hypothetical protein
MYDGSLATCFRHKLTFFFPFSDGLLAAVPGSSTASLLPISLGAVAGTKHSAQTSGAKMICWGAKRFGGVKEVCMDPKTPSGGNPVAHLVDDNKMYSPYITVSY